MECSRRSKVVLMASESTTRPNRIHLRPSEQRAILFIGDVIVTIIAMVIALYYWSYQDAQFEFTLSYMFWSVSQVGSIFLPFGWLILLVDLYDVHRAANWRETFRGIAVAAIAGFFSLCCNLSSFPQGITASSGGRRFSCLGCLSYINLAVVIYPSIYGSSIHEAGVNNWSGECWTDVGN